MSHDVEKSPYLLIFHHPAEQRACSEREDSDNFSKAMAWIDGLKSKGISLGGRPLEFEGRVLRPKGAPPIDGPFPEGKEVIGGTLLILARDLDEACAIASDCPGLKGDLIVEVRRVAQVPEEFKKVLS